jgi:hypothetical protein
VLEAEGLAFRSAFPVRGTEYGSLNARNAHFNPLRVTISQNSVQMGLMGLLTAILRLMVIAALMSKVDADLKNLHVGDHGVDLSHREFDGGCCLGLMWVERCLKEESDVLGEEQMIRSRLWEWRCRVWSLGGDGSGLLYNTFYRSVEALYMPRRPPEMDQSNRKTARAAVSGSRRRFKLCPVCRRRDRYFA